MGQRFELPQMGMMQRKLEEVRRNIQESKALMVTSKKYLKDYLEQINHINNPQHVDNIDHSKVSSLEVYKWFIAKEKSLYFSLNNMKPS